MKSIPQFGIPVCVLGLILSSQLSVKSTPEYIKVEYVFSLLGDIKGKGFKTAKGKRAVAEAIKYVESFGLTPYDFGRDLYYDGESQRAIFWCEALAIATNDPQYFYGRALYEWYSGDAEAAVRDVIFLTKKKLPPTIKARTYYLKGRINLQSHLFGDAEKDLQVALDTYKSIKGKFGGQYLCLTLMARAAIAQKDFDKAIELLEAAKLSDDQNVEYGNKPFGMATIHEMYGELYFEQRNFKASLEENEKSYQAFLDGRKKRLADGVLVKIGLLHFINGDPKKAYEIASGMWRKLENTDQARLWAYNNVTLAILASCTSDTGDYQVRKSEALSWAKADKGGQALIELVAFLENEIPCPELEEEYRFTWR